jgi:CHAD domain-containing protein
VPLRAEEDALDAFRRVLANLADTIDSNLEGTITDADPELLHELRVAIRRTRSVVSQGKGVLPRDIRARHREAFGWLGEISGPARDLDVHLLGWDAHVAPLGEVEAARLEPVRATLEARRQDAHEALALALRGDRTRAVLDGWRRWLADPSVTAEEPQALGPVVAKRIAKAQRTVLDHGRAITGTSPPQRLHDLRKDAKTLRYLLECFGGLFPTKPHRAFVRQLKDLQDNLGAHQDAAVHLAELRELAHDLRDRTDVDTDVLLAMGRFSAHLEHRRQAERRDFASRFKAYDTKKNRRSLEQLIDVGTSR